MLVILDKDLTLVQPLLGEGFVSHPRDQRLLPGVADRVRELKAAGVTMVIVSNQGGCTTNDPKTGKPYKTIDDAIDEMRYCMELLPEIEVAYFCPDSSGFYCHFVTKGTIGTAICKDKSFRKPAPGMLLLAIAQAGDTFATMIGDQESDQLAAKAAGVPFIWAEEFRSPKHLVLGSPNTTDYLARVQALDEMVKLNQEMGLYDTPGD